MDKHFCGKGWKKEFDNGGAVLNLSIKASELPEPDGYGNIRLTVAKLKHQDPKSKATHYVAWDTYKRKDSDVGF